MNTSQYIFDVKHLQKSFLGKVAVYDFSLAAKPGEIIGFLGPNGSGKTTTIRMLCGLLQPDKGEGECLGFNVLTESHLIRGKVGYMTQKFSLYDYLTIKENLNFVAHAFKVKNPAKEINEIADRLKLGKRLNQITGTLSGGWKQKLALAASLVHQPKLLLLDEPTAGVDPAARHEFWETINDLAAGGITALVSTHYMDEAERCHRLIYLAYGHIITAGSIKEIIQNANLNTWVVSGKNINELAKKLSRLDGIDQIVSFGYNLHISGSNRPKLLSSLRPYFIDANYQWQGVDSTLEDVFINLIADVQEKRFD